MHMTVGTLYARQVLFLSLVAFGLMSCAPAFKARIDHTLGEEIVWPPPPETPRIKYLWSLISFVPEGRPFMDFVAGSVEESAEPAESPFLLRPFSVYVDDQGLMYIVDQGLSRVSVVNTGTGEVRESLLCRSA